MSREVEGMGFGEKLLVVAMSAVYIAGLLCTIFEPLSFLDRSLFSPLHSSLGTVLGRFVSIPLVGLIVFWPAIAGGVVYHWPSHHLKFKLAVSSALISLFYLFGNLASFHQNQWLWLHLYLCGYLAGVGLSYPQFKNGNLLLFLFLVTWIVLRPAVPMWVFFDFCAGLYIIFVACRAWKLQPNEAVKG